MNERSSLVVCAWGNSPIVNKVMKRFPGYLPLHNLGELNCIDLAKDGTPKHPLYLKSDLQPKLLSI